MYLHLRGVRAVQAEGTEGTVRIVQRDSEIINPIQLACYGLSVWRSNCDRTCGLLADLVRSSVPAVAAGLQPFRLQSKRLILASDPSQIAGRGVAPATSAGSVEVCLALLGVASGHVLKRVDRKSTRLNSSHVRSAY